MEYLIAPIVVVLVTVAGIMIRQLHHRVQALATYDDRVKLAEELRKFTDVAPVHNTSNLLRVYRVVIGSWRNLNLTEARKCLIELKAADYDKALAKVEGAQAEIEMEKRSTEYWKRQWDDLRKARSMHQKPPTTSTKKGKKK